MADSITWLLNADASQVRAEMSSAVAAANSGTGTLVNGFDKADLAHGHLLASNKKVSAQLGHFTQSMLAGADATSLATDAFMGLSKIFKLPLLPLASLVVSGVAIKSVVDYRNEWKKVNEELDKAARPRAAGQNSAEDIKKHAEAASAAITKAEEKIQTEGIWGKMKRIVGDAWGSLLDTRRMGGQINFRGGPNQMSEVIKPSMVTSDVKAEAEKKIAKAREAQAKDAEDLAKLEHENLVQAQADKMKDSLQFSLADIAKEGRKRKTGTFDSGATYYGDVAQQALDEQMAARKAMMAGRFQEGIQHQSRAEELKASLPQLKDSDKVYGELVKLNLTSKEIVQKVTFKRGGATQ